MIATYKAMRANITELASKVTELDSDKAEHALVLRAIQPLPPSRKCFRSIGGVLVERSVGEVLPAVERNLRGIEELIAQLSRELREKEKEADEFRVRWNISMGDGAAAAAADEDEDDEAERRKQSNSSRKREGGTGVLA